MSVNILNSFLQPGIGIEKLLNASFFVAENIADFEKKNTDLASLLSFNNSIFGLTPEQNKEAGATPAAAAKPAAKPADAKPAAETKPADKAAEKPETKPAATTPNADSLLPSGVMPPFLNFMGLDFLIGAGQSGVPGGGLNSVGAGTPTPGSLGDFSIFNWLTQNPFGTTKPEPVTLPTSTNYLNGLFGSSFSALDPMRIISMFVGGFPGA